MISRLAALLLGLMVLTGARMPAADVGAGFPDLDAGQRVYDTTGESLSPAGAADLARRIDALDRDTGADTVVYVRELDASPEATFDQVQALQQAWAAATGADEDTAVAILINREPGDLSSARAGIYVGSTFDDGNVPRDEQEAIVADALIPPLRDGDVSASLTAGLDRLGSSIRNGPPRTAFERFAETGGRTWLPVGLTVLALAGLAWAGRIFGRRDTTDAPIPEPTTARPAPLPPAIGGALALGIGRSPTEQAVILDLAARGALEIEPDDEKVQVHLLDPGLVRDAIEQCVWDELAERAEQGVVSASELAGTAGAGPVREAVQRQMSSNGWLNDAAGAAHRWLIILSVGAFVVAVGAVAVAAEGGGWPMAVAVVALLGLAAATAMMYLRFSTFTAAGQEAARPWQAYHQGLKAAAEDDSIALDLDTVLPDVVALGLGWAMAERLSEAGPQLRAFQHSGAATSTPNVAWVAYSGAFTTGAGHSGSGMVGGGMVGGGGAGGGGGAAGST